MLLKEKVETAFESLKDSDRMTEVEYVTCRKSSGCFVSEQRVAAEDFIRRSRSGSWSHCPSHRMRRSQSLKRKSRP